MIKTLVAVAVLRWLYFPMWQSGEMSIDDFLKIINHYMGDNIVDKKNEDEGSDHE